jgi:hypothetical protein
MAATPTIAISEMSAPVKASELEDDVTGVAVGVAVPDEVVIPVAAVVHPV